MPSVDGPFYRRWVMTARILIRESSARIPSFRSLVVKEGEDGPRESYKEAPWGVAKTDVTQDMRFSRKGKGKERIMAWRLLAVAKVTD